jgi:hypothetical protein
VTEELPALLRQSEQQSTTSRRPEAAGG